MIEAFNPHESEIKVTRKLPSEAFDVYFAMGDARSYQSIAEHFGVSKTAVTNRAKKESWQERIESLEAKARESTDQKLVETREAMNARHLRSLKAIQGKALEALKSMSLSTAMEAVRALETGVKLERLVRGEPSDRTAVSVEDAIKREYESWLSEEAEEDDHVDEREAAPE